MLDCSQLPVTPVPEDLPPSTGLRRHWTPHTHPCTYLKIKIMNNFRTLASIYRYRRTTSSSYLNRSYKPRLGTWFESGSCHRSVGSGTKPSTYVHIRRRKIPKQMHTEYFQQNHRKQFPWSRQSNVYLGTQGLYNFK